MKIKKNIINLDWTSLQIVKTRKSKSLSMYQHQFKNLFIVFFYGDDFSSSIFYRISAGVSCSVYIFSILSTGVLNFEIKKISYLICILFLSELKTSLEKVSISKSNAVRLFVEEESSNTV